MMLNNAGPRIMSDGNGFDFFVTEHCTIPIQPTIFEMNSNNAWSINNPPAPKGWEQDFENFRDHKSFPLVQNDCGVIYQDTTPLSTDESSNSQTTPRYAAVHSTRQPNKGHTFPIPFHPVAVPTINQGYGSSSSTLGVDYSQLSMDQGRRSFTAFQNCINLTPLPRAQVPFSSNASAVEGPFSNDNTSESAIDGELSTLATSAPNRYVPLELRHHSTHDGIFSGIWSNRADNHMNNIESHSSEAEISGSYRVSNFPDRLPRLQDEQQEGLTDDWNPEYWPSGQLVPSTVRPKALNLNALFGSTVSTVSIATTASSHTSTSSSEPTAMESSPEETPSPSDEEEQSVDEPVQTTTRHMLPSSRPIRYSDSESAETNKPRRYRRARASTPVISAVANTRSHTLIKVDPVPEAEDDKRESLSPPVDDDLERGLPEGSSRSEQNKFLVRARMAGMSYKGILSKGNFTDAESTLRGRFRTLTKDKKDRVRKPIWTANDLRLLNIAVRSKKCKRGKGDSRSQRVEWKKVAGYIADNGGSYRFGYATCRKRWVEMTKLETGR